MVKPRPDFQLMKYTHSSPVGRESLGEKWPRYMESVLDMPLTSAALMQLFKERVISSQFLHNRI